ncbi:hypothetical protein [Saccharothrix sp. ST-888]|uniref:hypothetical protein n=1 Tax=Saccharothrix sp. ST-888 TaxID=1427391 RepID=UPI0012E0A3E4|nr:hypothetical protein [Saccharothrix sp. ST-888]
MGTVAGVPGADLFETLLPQSELARAVGRFDGDVCDLVQQSVRAAERAFGELDACDALLDRATAQGRALAEDLGRLAAVENEQDIPCLLDALKQLADEVQRSEETRRLLTRILGRGEPEARWTAPVPHLSEEQLPPVPSVYDEKPAGSVDQPGGPELMAGFAPRLEAAHAERIRQTSSHLLATVRRMAGPELADPAFVHESLVEADLTFELWRRCLADRRLDLD